MPFSRIWQTPANRYIRRQQKILKTKLQIAAQAVIRSCLYVCKIHSNCSPKPLDWGFDLHGTDQRCVIIYRWMSVPAGLNFNNLQ
jgi:hypothetical protein